jgi:hypothetical protein
MKQQTKWFANQSLNGVSHRGRYFFSPGFPSNFSDAELMQ